jgi:hypothetical protein
MPPRTYGQQRGTGLCKQRYLLDGLGDNIFSKHCFGRKQDWPKIMKEVLLQEILLRSLPVFYFGYKKVKDYPKNGVVDKQLLSG